VEDYNILFLKEGKQMELKTYLGILRKRFLFILTLTSMSILLCFLLTKFFLINKYSSSISVLITNTSYQNSSDKNNISDMLMYQQLVQTYAEFSKTNIVSQDVINELKLPYSVEQLKSMITVNPKTNTEFLTLTIISDKKNELVPIANQFALSLKKVTKTIKSVDNVQIVDTASLPENLNGSSIIINTLIGLFVGLLFSITMSFLLEYLDTTVKNEDELSILLNVPVLGMIPNEKIRGV
jgi:capsular polysaccharide biosynthesis protein